MDRIGLRFSKFGGPGPVQSDIFNFLLVLVRTEVWRPIDSILVISSRTIWFFLIKIKVENGNYFDCTYTLWHSWFSCYICPRPWCVYCKWYLFKLSSNLLHQPLTEFGASWLVLVQPPPFSSHSQPCFVQFLKPQRFNANLWIQFLRKTNNFCAWNTNKICWK